MKRENLRLAFWLWLMQFCLTLTCAFFDWTHLSLWDSMWYRHIVDHGYSDTLTPGPFQGGNVGFFPGYPLLGWLFKSLLQVSSDAGLLIASSVSAFLTWLYFAEYCDLRGARSPVPSAIWMILYPFSFFFVVAYSDSLSAASTLGYLLFSERWLRSVMTSNAVQLAPLFANQSSAWVGSHTTSYTELQRTADLVSNFPRALENPSASHSAPESPGRPLSPEMTPLIGTDSPRQLGLESPLSQTTGSMSRLPHWRWFLLAALHGYCMTFTRILNLLFVLYPVVRAIQLRARPATLIRLSALALIASCGVASFFAYCRARFGAWNFYFITEHKIWGWSGSVFQWDKLLPPRELFDFARPFRGDTVGRYVTLFFGVYFCILLRDLIRQRRFREPIAAAFLFGGMFWGAYLLGRSTWGFTGMGRYLIPIWLLFLPEWRLPRLPSLGEVSGSQRIAWGALALAMFILQIVFAAMFARNGWVA